jgi:hypothetical protein
MQTEHVKTLSDEAFVSQTVSVAVRQLDERRQKLARKTTVARMRASKLRRESAKECLGALQSSHVIAFDERVRMVMNTLSYCEATLARVRCHLVVNGSKQHVHRASCKRLSRTMEIDPSSTYTIV